MWPRTVVQEAHQLWINGARGTEIAGQLGVPQRTVAHWIADWSGRGRSRGRRVEQAPPWPPDLRAYSYLLGLYLGDGHIASLRGSTFILRVTLDAAYPRIAAEAMLAMRRVLPTRNPRVGRVRNVRAYRVECNSRWWPDLLPQHGAGRKHNRRIALEPWQELITQTHPHELLRGLIHSDGCRYVAHQRQRTRTYSYPRYAFSNRSRDIQRIFCDHADLLGISWTQSSEKQIQIARREAVAILDGFVGPKQ